MTNKIEMRVDTVTFISEGIEVQSYRQFGPPLEGSTEPEMRWVFHPMQVLGNNQISIANVGDMTILSGEVAAPDEKTRDELASKIISVVLETKKSFLAIQSQISESLKELLPEQAEVSQPMPMDLVPPPAP